MTSRNNTRLPETVQADNAINECKRQKINVPSQVIVVQNILTDNRRLNLKIDKALRDMEGLRHKPSPAALGECVRHIRTQNAALNKCIQEYEALRQRHLT